MDNDVLAALDAIPRGDVAAAIAYLAARAMAPDDRPDTTEGSGALLDVAAVAERLHVSRRWVYTHSRALGGRKVGRFLRFRVDRVDAYAERRR